jgi:T5SS/PEP-CTERM-associated repeat protein/autotransporter-associated beta strand protein
MKLLRPHASLPFSRARSRHHLLAALSVLLIASSTHAFDSGATVYWNGGDGTWDTTAEEWSTDPTFATGLAVWDNSASLDAIFNGPGSTITTSNPVTARSVSFNTDGHIFNGATLTLDSTFTTVDTGSGTQTISANLAGGGTVFTKLGSGTLLLTAANALSATNGLDLTAGTVAIRGSDASLGLAGTATRIYIGVGMGGSANLVVDNGGALKSTYGGIGNNEANGTAIVDGPGSTWTLTSGLDIGPTGVGSLTISDGGVVTNQSASTIGFYTGSEGSVTVTGDGSIWNVKGIRLGVSGDAEGSLMIVDGGKVFNTGSAIGMSNGTDSTSSITVTGSGSLLSGGSLQVGNVGKSTLLVSDGGKITGSSGWIGFANGGEGDATITGAGSSWAITGGFSMDGDSTFEILNGATFAAGNSSLGEGPDAISTATISGSGSAWTSSTTMVVGYSGTATLNIGAGTSVSTGNWLRIGQDETSKGTIIQTGGTVDIGTYLQFNAGTPVYRLEGGTLKVGDTSYAGIQSYTDATFDLAGGTIEAKGDSLTIYADAALRDGTVTTLSTPGSADQVMFFESILSGSGAIRKTGAGALYLDAPTNSFSGGIELQQGIVNPYHQGSLGSGALNFTGNATLQLDGGSYSFANNIALTADVTGTIEVASGLTTALSGTITGEGNLAKTGAGSLVLSGANTYTGATSVDAGSLFVNGSLANTTVTVANGATLGGSGSIGGSTTLQSGAQLAPGAFGATGALAFSNNLTLVGGAILDFQLGATSDLIRVSGGILTGSIGAGGLTLNLSDAAGFDPLTGGTFTLFNFSGADLADFDASDFTFGTLLSGTTLDGYSLNLDLNARTLSVSYSASAIPEPSTYAALAGALVLGLAFWRRRRATSGV